MTPTSQFNPLAHLLWYPLSISISGTISQMFPTCLVFGVSEEASFKVRGKKWSSNPSHNLLSWRPVTQSSGFHEWFPSAWTLAFSVHSHPQLVTKPVHNVIGALEAPLREGCSLLVNETESVSVLGRNLTFQATKIIRVHLSIIWPRGYNGVCDPWRKTLDSIQS